MLLATRDDAAAISPTIGFELGDVERAIRSQRVSALDIETFDVIEADSVSVRQAGMDARR